MAHPKLPDPIPLTKDAHDKLKDDLDVLTKEQDEILVRLQKAREMGDLSENGAYKYAKFELGNVRRKLGRVHYLLRYGIVQDKSAKGTADFGHTITLTNDHKTLTFTLVSEHESNPSANKLSTKSPIGQATLGKKVGDRVVITTPRGETTYTLTSIS